MLTRTGQLQTGNAFEEFGASGMNQWTRPEVV